MQRADKVRALYKYKVHGTSHQIRKFGMLVPRTQVDAIQFGLGGIQRIFPLEHLLVRKLSLCEKIFQLGQPG
jgi:hypothetical protein